MLHRLSPLSSAHRTLAVLLALVALSLTVAAQRTEHSKHHHYALVDLGTFGGPGGGICNPSCPALNAHGSLVGTSDASTSDPFSPDCFIDCFVSQAWVWREGKLSKLAPLPGGASSIAVSVNAFDKITGQAQNGAVDPLTGWPEANAVLWHHRAIVNLGTLGGNQSNANAINDQDQIVGAALTVTPDPSASNPLSFCFLCNGGTFATSTIFSPAATETHAFLWQQGYMLDLGTLGGPDSNAWIINNRGQVAGWSFTSFVPNPSTGVPTVDPFFWDPDDGRMTDLGSLGGTYGQTYFLNNRGQVVGFSNLAGDAAQHPFIWGRSQGIQDLGTLGGTFGFATWINDSGEVVGGAFTEGDQAGHAFIWRGGVMTDLGTVGTDPDSEAYSINSHDQVAGTSFSFAQGDLHGFLWEDSGPVIDLNTLVVPPSKFTVTSALAINDSGEIGCLGLEPGGTITHACVLIPCDENHSHVEGCDTSLVSGSSLMEKTLAKATSAGQPRTGMTPSDVRTPFRHRIADRFYGSAALRPTN